MKANTLSSPQKGTLQRDSFMIIDHKDIIVYETSGNKNDDILDTETNSKVLADTDN